MPWTVHGVGCWSLALQPKEVIHLIFFFFCRTFLFARSRRPHESQSQGLPRIRQKDNESSGRSCAKKEKRKEARRGEARLGEPKPKQGSAQSRGKWHPAPGSETRDWRRKR